MTVDGLHPTLALALTKCPKYPCGFDAVPSNLKYCGASCCVPPLSSLHDLPTSRVFGAVWLAGPTVVVRMWVQRKHDLLDENPETKHCWGNDFSTYKNPNMADPPITMNSWWCGAKAVSLHWGSQQLQEGIPPLIRQGNAHADPMSIDMFCCHGSVRGQHCCFSMRYFAVGWCPNIYKVIGLPLCFRAGGVQWFERCPTKALPQLVSALRRLLCTFRP